MSYISLINDFWKVREKEIIPSHTADLYMYLLHRCNKGNWVNPFSLSTKEIERDLDLTRPTIYRARMLLMSLGLVEFSEGKTRGSHAIYALKNAPKKSECVKECVKEIYTNEGECVKKCVKECVKEIYTIAEKKESFPLQPLYKEKKEINKEKKDSKTTHMRAHEEPKTITKASGVKDGYAQMRIVFLSRMAMETMMKELALHDKQTYIDMVDEVIANWKITEGENIEVTSDKKKHFMSVLRIKNRERNANNVQDNKDKRRATDVSATRADAYGDSF